MSGFHLDHLPCTDSLLLHLTPVSCGSLRISWGCAPVPNSQSGFVCLHGPLWTYYSSSTSDFSLAHDSGVCPLFSHNATTDKILLTPLLGRGGQTLQHFRASLAVVYPNIHKNNFCKDLRKSLLDGIKQGKSGHPQEEQRAGARAQN